MAVSIIGSILGYVLNMYTNHMDIYLVVYLTFRLLPFLIAAVLSIAPLANYNMRGFVYLVGLILSVAGTSIAGYIIASLTENTYSVFKLGPAQNPTASCNAFAFSDKQVPLDLAILGYSIGYLLYSMIINGIVLFNTYSLIFFAVAIGGTSYWINANACFSIMACLVSVIVSGSLGAFWGYIIHKQVAHLQYLYTPSNKQTCYRKNDNTFSCSDTNENGSIEANTND